MPRPDLHTYFLGIALAARERACCLGSKVGAILVRDRHIIATGYNGTPAGHPNCDEEEQGCHRCANPSEYPAGSAYDRCLCIHAEQNAVLMAAKFGISVEGAVCYTTMRPCFGCSKELIQVGVEAVHFIHGWSHPDPAHQEQYLALQDNFPGGVHQHNIHDPKADWAVRAKRTTT